MPTDAYSGIRISTYQIYILVGCIAAATMGLELIQIRILSFLYYNNVVYLTVTIAMLGFGISGVVASLLANRVKNSRRVISILALGFVFSPLVCLYYVSRIPAYFESNVFNINKLLSSYILLVIPFLFSGAALGWAFMTHAKSINKLYGTDLVCSSLAVVAFVLLIYPLGANWFLWLCSGLVLIGFLLYSNTIFTAFWRYSTILMYIGAMLLLNSHLLGNMPEGYKTLGELYKNGSVHIEQTAWTPITRIDVSSSQSSQPILSFNASDIKVITQDATAPTPLLGPNIVNTLLQEIPKGKLLRAISLIYYLNKRPQNALIIGVGGGTDVLTAKIMGAQNVTGVEINPVTVKLITGSYRDYLQWPNWNGIEIIRAEGRNYAHSKSHYFDTMVMSGIDTFSALNSGAYVLSENYLYTVEAIEDYLNAIKPNGVVGIYRWLFIKPRETLRLSSLYLTAAKEMSITHPEQCILIVSDNLGWLLWGATFFKKEPFTQTEVNEVLSLVEKEPSMSIIYLPKVFPKQLQAELEQKIRKKHTELNFARLSFNTLIDNTEKGRAQFIHDYMFRIDPVQDDRPFFFEYFKENIHQDIPLSFVRGPTVLYALLIICSLLCLGCIVLPLFVFQRRGLKTPGVVPLLLYFSCLGFGFMMFEIGAMQRISVYIGDPMYSLSIILAGLLLSTAIGSVMSGKFLRAAPLTIILYAMIAIAILIIVWLIFIAVVQPLTLHYALITRIFITLLALIPVGVLLGIPFPTAINAITKQYTSFIPWAWGVNGVTSVLASIVAIITAMNFGFSITVITAAIVYLLGGLFYWIYYQKLITSTPILPPR